MNRCSAKGDRKMPGAFAHYLAHRTTSRLRLSDDASSATQKFSLESLMYLSRLVERPPS